MTDKETDVETDAEQNDKIQQEAVNEAERIRELEAWIEAERKEAAKNLTSEAENNAERKHFLNEMDEML